MNIQSAKYMGYTPEGETEFVVECIKAVIDEVVFFVPLIDENRHYVEIMRQVEAGTLTIQPADVPPQEEPQA